MKHKKKVKEKNIGIYSFPLLFYNRPKIRLDYYICISSIIALKKRIFSKITLKQSKAKKQKKSQSPLIVYNCNNNNK